MSPGHRTGWIVGTALMVAVFGYDLNRPLGVAAAVPYAAVPLVGLMVRSQTMILVLSGLSSLLTIAGFWYSPDGGLVQTVVANRAIALITIWAIGALALYHLRTEIRLRSQLEERADSDPLTGLKNRRYAFEVLEQEFDRFRRYGSPFSVVLIDADHFKHVNDTFGHIAGDSALKRIAELCLQCARHSDTVSRFGGEEFLIVVPNTDAEDARVLAERVRRAVSAETVTSGTRSRKLTVSLGVAQADRFMREPKELIRKADTALFEAKTLGRNRVVVAAAPPAPTPVREAVG